MTAVRRLVIDQQGLSRITAARVADGKPWWQSFPEGYNRFRFPLSSKDDLIRCSDLEMDV